MTSARKSLSLCELVKGDLKAQKARNTSFLTMLAYLRRASFSAVLIYRLSAACVHKGALGKLAAMFLVRLNIFLHACEIYPEAVIGPGFNLPHPMGVVIGKITAGRNVIVHQCVTLGAHRFTDDGESPETYPILDDYAHISVGAVVMGHARIGRNALVGANAVVFTDVPDNAIAVGVPARILDKRRPPVND